MLIRNFEAKDISNDYLSWLNDKSHMQFSNQKFKLHTSSTSLDYLQSFQNSDNYFLAIEVGGRMVGTATLYMNPRTNSLDLGLLIGNVYSGRGYGKEAVSEILKLDLFERLGINCVTAGTSKLNLGMQAVLEANGFLFDGEETLNEMGKVAGAFLYYRKHLE